MQRSLPQDALLLELPEPSWRRLCVLSVLPSPPLTGGDADDVFVLAAGAFRTASARWRARAYLTGLLAPIERRTAWRLSEATGNPNPDGVQ